MTGSLRTLIARRVRLGRVPTGSLPRILIPLALLVLVVNPGGSPSAAAQGTPGPAPEAGRVDLAIAGEGREVQVRLAARPVSLVGFEGAPSDEGQTQALRLTRSNLETGDGLVRFSTRAGCRLTGATVDMAAAGEGETGSGVQLLSARYRFACDQPELLESAALGLFVAFPALRRVFVRYDLAGVRGEAELNRTRPVVTFVPLY